MPRLLFRTLVLAAVLAPVSGEAAAQQRNRSSLEVVVLENGSNRPVSGARVHVSGVAPAITDAEGRAQIADVPRGARMVTISRIGYDSERVTVEFAREAVQAEVELRQQPIELAGLRVTSWGRSSNLRNRGYYDRERIGHGVFVNRDEIQKRNLSRMLDLFRQVRGFQVSYNMKGEPYLESARGPCKTPPLFFMDGMRVHDVSGRGDLSDFVSPDEVEAIEAYTGAATIPAQYNPTGAACGVILIWTRMGT